MHRLDEACSTRLTCKIERAAYPDWRQLIRICSRMPASPDSSHQQLVGCRLCHHENCFVTPTYNYPGEKKRIFCVTHKLEGMVSNLADVFSAQNCLAHHRVEMSSPTLQHRHNPGVGSCRLTVQ